MDGYVKLQMLWQDQSLGPDHGTQALFVLFYGSNGLSRQYWSRSYCFDIWTSYGPFHKLLCFI